MADNATMAPPAEQQTAVAAPTVKYVTRIKTGHIPGEFELIREQSGSIDGPRETRRERELHGHYSFTLFGVSFDMVRTESAMAARKAGREAPMAVLPTAELTPEKAAQIQAYLDAGRLVLRPNLGFVKTLSAEEAAKRTNTDRIKMPGDLNGADWIEFRPVDGISHDDHQSLLAQLEDLKAKLARVETDATDDAEDAEAKKPRGRSATGPRNKK